MRTLKIIEHISLDGVIQISNCGDDFPYGDWTAPYRTPAGAQAVTAAYGDAFDLLLGRRTYDAWSEWWPKAPESAIGSRINAATKYVVTHRPDSLPWGPAKALGADFIDKLQQIKARGNKDLILSGSTTLTPAVLESGLVDEILLIIYPTVLGTGKRLFLEGTPGRSFKLVSTSTTPTGIILSHYASSGEAIPLPLEQKR